MIKIKCWNCGEMFEDVNYKKEYGTAKRLFCNKCIDKCYKDKLKNGK